jgi:hypothetical protein
MRACRTTWRTGGTAEGLHGGVQRVQAGAGFGKRGEDSPWSASARSKDSVIALIDASDDQVVLADVRGS